LFFVHKPLPPVCAVHSMTPCRHTAFSAVRTYCDLLPDDKRRILSRQTLPDTAMLFSILTFMVAARRWREDDAVAVCRRYHQRRRSLPISRRQSHLRRRLRVRLARLPRHAAWYQTVLRFRFMYLTSWYACRAGYSPAIQHYAVPHSCRNEHTCTARAGAGNDCREAGGDGSTYALKQRTGYASTRPTIALVYPTLYTCIRRGATRRRLRRRQALPTVATSGAPFGTNFADATCSSAAPLYGTSTLSWLPGAL